MTAGERAVSKGMTLIELLVALAVLVIVVTVGIPGFGKMISSSREVADFNALLTGLHYARSEAVKRRAPVKVVVEDEDGAWKLDVVVDDDVIRQYSGSAGVSASSGEVSFNPLGRRVADSCTFEDCVVIVGGGRGVEIKPTGHIGRLE